MDPNENIKTYTRGQITDAFNRAADEAQGLLYPGDGEEMRDASNLTVNAGLYFLDHPDGSLAEAVSEMYGSLGDWLIELIYGDEIGR